MGAISLFLLVQDICFVRHRLATFWGAVEKYPNYVEKYLRYRVFFMVFFSTFNVAVT